MDVWKNNLARLRTCKHTYDGDMSPHIMHFHAYQAYITSNPLYIYAFSWDRVEFFCVKGYFIAIFCGSSSCNSHSGLTHTWQTHNEGLAGGGWPCGLHRNNTGSVHDTTPEWAQLRQWRLPQPGADRRGRIDETGSIFECIYTTTLHCMLLIQ